MQQKRESGFTLIELVMVIVVLGILAATATSKFVNLSTDAKVASLEGVAGAMRSGLTLVRSEAGIQGKTTGDDVIDFLGTDINVYNGYPAVDTSARDYAETNRQVKAWLEIDTVDVTTRGTEGDDPSTLFFVDQASSLNYIYIFFSEDYDRKSINLECHVLYTNAENSTPSVSVLTDDC